MANFERINTVKDLKKELLSILKLNKGVNAIHPKFMRDHIAPGHLGMDNIRLSKLIAYLRSTNQEHITRNTLLIGGEFIKKAHLEIENWINKAPDDFFIRDDQNGWEIKRGAMVPSMHVFSFLTVTNADALKRASLLDDSAQRGAEKRYITKTTNGVRIGCCLGNNQIYIYHVEW